jgi:hypothetical protein
MVPLKYHAAQKKLVTPNRKRGGFAGDNNRARG